MPEYNALPAEISDAVDRLAKRRAQKGDEDSALYARLAVLNEVRDQMRAAENEVIEHLRRSPRRNTWTVIASNMGLALNIAWQRYGSESSKAPRRRVERSAPRRPRSQPQDLPGISVAEAAELVHDYPASIYKRIRELPDATWFTRVPNPGAEVPTIRVVDVDELKKALVGNSIGVTLAQAARSLGVTVPAIRELMKAKPEAAWFAKVERDGVRAATLIIDMPALSRDLKRRI